MEDLLEPAFAEIDTDSFEVLSAHPFCRGLRKEVVLGISRASKRWVFTTVGRVILNEGSLSTELSNLWILTRGAVEVIESGQTLCTLENGSVFGDSVAFSRCDRQPFTIKVLQVPVIAWCLPSADLRQTIKLHASAGPLMDEFVDQQERRILWPRVSKLLLLSHCGPNFAKQLLKKVSIRHVRAHNLVWSPATSRQYLQVVLVGTLLVEKVSTDAFQLHDEVPGSPSILRSGTQSRMFERRKTTHVTIGSTEFSDEAETSRSQKRLSGPVSPMSPTTLQQLKSFAATKSMSGFEYPVLDEDSSNSSSSSVTDEENEENSDLSSGSSSTESSSESSEVEELYDLPETLSVLEPTTGTVQAKAGPYCLVFNEPAVLNYTESEAMLYRQAVALTDCIFLLLKVDDFREAVERAPREKKRFDLLANAEYREWQRCGIHRLRSLEIFAKCSKQFLSDLAQTVESALCFHGNDIIAADEDATNGLVLFMQGHAQNEKRHKVQAPEVLSSMNWLGDRHAAEPPRRVKAKEVCQILRISQSKLLSLLSRHPHETAVIVNEANRINSRKHGGYGGRAAAFQRTLRDGANGAQGGGLFWYCPFCDGLGEDFLQELITHMECFKLIPGQHLFRNLDGANADFLVVLTRGRLMASDDDLDAPLIICGFDRSGYIDTVAEELSEVFCVNFEQIKSLLAVSPESTRAFLIRVALFQERLEKRQGLSWWSSLNVLRRHEPFAACTEAFIEACAPFMQVRFCLPGEAIVEEGNHVEHALIIESGVAKVHRQTKPALRGCPDRTGEVRDSYLVGGISGAYGFAGMQRRLATIKAVTLCKLIEIPIAAILTLLDQHPDARQRFREIAERRFKELAPEPLEEHPFFKNFSKSFLNTLRTKCNAQVFFVGETIIRQGDPADSMIIISSASVVTLYVDGRKLKDLAGGCTLGVPSILSPAAVKRFATIEAQTACTVQKLTRKDWLDVLKNHAEHRLWIQSFTEEQLALANQQALETTRRYRWRKIKERETAAVQTHCRRAKGQMQKGPKQASVKQALAEAKDVPLIGISDSYESYEHWDCFNGRKATVPHVRLPQLSLRPQKIEVVEHSEEEDVLDEATRSSTARRGSDFGGMAMRKMTIKSSNSSRLSVLGELPHMVDKPMSHESWLDCQDAFGLLYTALGD
ncbi:Hcn4 [Symbiodinium sp. CCMP2456]|nr:Hcn4 [Symbiodinium sp. CCMP2456]